MPHYCRDDRSRSCFHSQQEEHPCLTPRRTTEGEEEENPFWNSCLGWKEASEAIRFQVRSWQIVVVSDAVLNIFRIILKGMRWDRSWRTLAVVSDALSILKCTNSSPLMRRGSPSKTAFGVLVFKNNLHFHSGSISWWSHLTAPVLCKVAGRVIHPDGMSPLKSVLDKETRNTWNSTLKHSVLWPFTWPPWQRESEDLPPCCLLTLVRHPSADIRTAWMSRALGQKTGYFWFDKALADILLLASAGSLMFITCG